MTCKCNFTKFLNHLRILQCKLCQCFHHSRLLILLQNFTVRSVDMFCKFLFLELLELVDIDWKGPGGPDHCNRFHLMPRFARSLPGKLQCQQVRSC